MPIGPYDVDPRSDEEKVSEVYDPGPNRIHEVLGLVALVLLSLIAGILIERLQAQSRWIAICIVTVFLGTALGVVRVISRRQHR